MTADCQQASPVDVAIIGDAVVLRQDSAIIVIPFTAWNNLIERIGHRTPTVDPPDGAP